MEKITLSSSLEDYLETIAEIIAEKGHAHTKDIADRLQVKMPSVTNALLGLSQRGLISYQSHAPVILTPGGAETAAVIRRRHESLRRFFGEILMLDKDEADRIACKIEHAAGEKVIGRIAVLTEAVNDREDAEPLREYLHNVMPQICVENVEELIALDQLRDGHSAIVVKVAESLRGIKKFADLGLVKGSLVYMVGQSPLGSLLRIKIMGSSLSIRKKDAKYIWVKPTE